MPPKKITKMINKINDELEMEKLTYTKPGFHVINMKPTRLICTSEAQIKCPNCGSKEYTVKKVEDKGGKVMGWVIGTIATLINPSSGAHMAHRAMEYDPTKEVKVCKKCGHQWE